MIETRYDSRGCPLTSKQKPAFAERERGHRNVLGEVVTDLTEDVRELIAHEHHGHDHGHRDDRDDERVLHETLTRVFT